MLGVSYVSAANEVQLLLSWSRYHWDATGKMYLYSKQEV